MIQTIKKPSKKTKGLARPPKPTLKKTQRAATASDQLSTEAKLAFKLINHARPREILSMRDFAEKHVWVTHASRAQPFRIRTQPFLGCLFDCLEDPHWWEAYFTGPSQSSKTTGAFLIPMAHTIDQRRESLVAGIPLDEMVNDKLEDLLAMMRISPHLRNLIPKTHLEEGRGGKIKEKFKFNNGTEIKPITAGGSDQAAAGYPARFAIVTEAAGFSQAKTTSSESDRLRQIKARLRSHERHRRRLWVEGTITNDEELPYRARGPEPETPEDIGDLISSLTRLLSPCPHCPEWILPGREHLLGWKEARTEIEAMENAYFLCPKCGSKITDDERRHQMQYVQHVHYGQSINEHGEIIGELPPTHTLYFPWRPYNNMLLSIGDVAYEEWKADQIDEGTQDRENAEKELCQFVHAVPFISTLVEDDKLDSKVLRKRISKWERNVLPPDTDKLTLGVDIGDWTGWWVLVAHRDCGIRQIVAYGCFDVKRSRGEKSKERIDAALDQFEDEIMAPGFVREGSIGRIPIDVAWFDGNYLTEEVAKWIKKKNRDGKKQYRFVRGAGKSTRTRFGGSGLAFRAPNKVPQYSLKNKSKQLIRIGKQWYAESNPTRGIRESTFNADYWKVEAAEGLKIKPGRPRSIELYAPASPKEHVRFTNHCANEQLHRTLKPLVGMVENWVRTGEQHFLDALVMALAAGDDAGYKPSKSAIEEILQGAKEKESGEKETPTPKKSTKKYDWGALR